MMTVISRVLVVDDYEPWRRHITAALQASRRWQVVGEASDGPEAVQKARALRPDLILLDVGLPTLNGILTARQIVDGNPNSKILFVSEHRIRDIVEAALGTGARGYLVKSDASGELLPAMEVIAAGGRFISPSLTREARDSWQRERIVKETSRHVAGFYSDEAFLVGDYTRFAETALKAGKAVIAIATAPHLDAIQQDLRARGIDIDRVIREGRYLPANVTDALAGCMVDDWPDETRFWAGATSLITEAAAASTGEGRRVVALGGCAPTLWKEGKAEAAVRLEQLWDEAVRRYELDALCGYSTQSLPHDEDGHIFQRICAAHSAVHSR